MQIQFKKLMEHSADSSSLATAFQSQTFKRQLELLDEKILLQQKEYQSKTQMLLMKVNSLSQSEIKFRNQLTTKDKAIYELNVIIKDYQAELMLLKKRLCESEAKALDSTNEFNQIHSKFQTISQQLKAKEEEHNNLKDKLTECQYTKEQKDSKIKELVEVMKQYFDELSYLSKKNSVLDNDNFDLRNHLKNIEIELKQLANERDTVLNQLESLRNSNDNLKSINAELNNAMNTLKNDNEGYRKDNYNMNQLLTKNTIDIEQYKSTIVNHKKEKEAIERENEKHSQCNRNLNEKLIQQENDNSELINKTSEEISKITKWIETHMNINDDSAFISQLPEMNTISINNNPKSQIANCLNDIKDKLYNSRAKMADAILNYRMIIDNINHQLKNKNELNSKIEQLYLRLRNEIRMITQSELMQIQTKTNKDCDLIDLIEEAIEFLLNDTSSKRNFNETQNAINEAEIAREQYNNIIPQINELKESNQQLVIEITKLNEENKLLDKKNRNLLTEMELKQMQINSQEQIINRRCENKKMNHDIAFKMNTEERNK